jgi:uncharacterized protein YkwD
MLLFLSILFNLVLSPPDMPLPVREQSGYSWSAEKVNKNLLLQLVNEARRKGVQCGSTWHPPVPPVTWNNLLENAARDHASDMYTKNYFSHIENDGSTANTRIEKAGYNWMAYGENIGLGYRSEKEVVDAWLKSPGHCANIMSKNYKEMGVGRAGDYWTQDFAAH